MFTILCSCVRCAAFAEFMHLVPPMRLPQPQYVAVVIVVVGQIEHNTVPSAPSFSSVCATLTATNEHTSMI